MVNALDESRRKWEAQTSLLKKKAFDGDEEAVEKLSILLPNDMASLVQIDSDGNLSPSTKFPYTLANFARDLAFRANPKARESLIWAWSKCHRATIGSLAGRVDWRKEDLKAVVQLFEEVRKYDPHIVNLPSHLRVWRAQSDRRLGAGMSWSRTRRVARWFAEVYLPAKGILNARVISRQISPDDILALIEKDEGRDGEDEVILRPL